MSTDPALRPFVAIDDVHYRYGDGPAIVDGVDLTVQRGEIHCLLGRSGCGKTTLLKLAAGLVLPDDGSVSIGGEALRQPGQHISFVFQTPTLLDWLTVLDNVLLPITLKRRPGAGDRAAAADLLERVGLSDYARHRPFELSGGQRSRVAVARALIGDPVLLLLDEPFAALDALTREDLQDDLLRLCTRTGMTVLFVTHDIAEAVYLGDKISVMSAGRLIDTRDVALPRPRHRDMRYAPGFGELCRQVREVMDVAAGPHASRRHAG
ncbi:ABC transporter ATP-binding protein [Pseudochelatococcus contaminans]|uniref:NitT/TauT family transport system ATP-binding protein n=1 Tax=Pseudochelatococcus contaminans TaxID=1538103 RepID=A0A7W6EID6_9HYPH|nr:ABC transporter ATP-binding protein [Pseudochelatococcus contaminans]MBB3810667.1 NitT/TauT family transport system ATP-binding protein [Pseudochelatococcus contaminans]